MSEITFTSHQTYVIASTCVHSPITDKVQAEAFKESAFLGNTPSSSHLKGCLAHYNARVLAAEDNLVSQKILYKQFNDWGCTVQIVTNGVELVECFKKDDYSLIVTDWHMPELDGLSAADQIKKSDRYKEHPIPILLLTAGDIRGLQQAPQAIDLFLQKPYKQEELASHCRTLLETNSF